MMKFSSPTVTMKKHMAGK